MNKISKIVSLAMATAVCAGSVSIPVFAAEVETAAVNSETAVTIAAVEDFSIEKYPYSYVKHLDDDLELSDSGTYNESNKYKGSLSTQAANPGVTFGPGYKGEALIATFYSSHRNSYGGDAPAYYGNVVNTKFTSKSEKVYVSPVTGSVINLSLSEATTGTSKVAFWTKAMKTDDTDRVAPETIQYTMSFSGSGASDINVKIPADGEWHYVVADLATPFGDGFTGITVKGNHDATFGSENGGMPALKLDGVAGKYPLDKQGEEIKDIDEAYVLINDKYVLAKTFNREYESDPNGRYIIGVDASGKEVYCKTDYHTYTRSLNEKTEYVYTEDPAGTFIYDTVSGKYYEAVDLNDKYSLASFESYQIDRTGTLPVDGEKRVLDENGNPIPVVICGNIVKEIWQTQIYVDEILFYRTTESGERTTFIPSLEEDLGYYANTELASILVDGQEVYSVANDGENRVITLPKNFDFSDPASADRITVVPKCPDIIHTAQKDGSAFVPIDVDSLGVMKSGASGRVTLPTDDSGKIIVSVVSSKGTKQEYTFDIKWGFDLSVTETKGTDTVSGGRKTFTIQNYGDAEKTVQILAAVKDSATNELKSVVVSTAASGVIPANGTKSISLTVPSTGLDKNNDTIYFYFYDSITSMNQVVSTYVIRPKQVK